MARAQAIETRLEQLLPALDEYYTSGFLTKAEVIEVSRQRTHWEYRLVAKPLLLLDVQDAVTYELGLEERLRVYCATSKLTLKHRWSILDRIERIYGIGLKNLKRATEREALRREFVLFLQRFERQGSLSKLYATLMLRYPTRADIWVEAVEWEGVTLHNMDIARSIVQQALVTMSGDQAVWCCALRLELHFVARLLRGLVAEYKAEKATKQQEATPSASVGEGGGKNGSVDPDGEHSIASVLQQRLEAENASLAGVLFDLTLARTVVQEALQSPASSPALVRQLLETAGAFSFTHDLVHELLRGAVATMAQALHDSTSSQAQRSRWEDNAAVRFICEDYLVMHDLLANRYSASLTSVTGFVDAEAALMRATPAAGDSTAPRVAAVQSLVALLTFASTRSGDVARLLTPMSRVVAAVVRGVEELLRRLASSAPRAASRVCRSLLRCHGELTANEMAQMAQWLIDKPKLTKALRQELVTAPREHVAALLRLVDGGAEPPRRQRRRLDTNHVTDEESAALVTRWPAGGLAALLLPEDRDVLSQGHHSSPHAIATLDDEAVERVVLWCTKEAQQRHDGAAADEAASRGRRRRAIIDFLRSHGFLDDGGDEARATKTAAATAALLLPPPPPSPRGLRSHPCRLLYRNATETPITMWRLFNVLEVMDGAAVLAQEADDGGIEVTADDSSSDDGSDDNGTSRLMTYRMQPRTDCLVSYATAGLAFLAGAAHALLSETAEWRRVEGVCTLLRSRLYSLTGLRQPTRHAVLHLLEHPQHGGGQSSVERCVAHVRTLLHEAQRCQPLPRHAQVTVLLPFLEALAIWATRAPHATLTVFAVHTARALHEDVLRLYETTRNVELYAPLVYDGTDCDGRSTRKADVSTLNVEDWLSYVDFERHVTADLHRAQDVIARARHACRAPQLLLSRLGALR